VASNLGNFANVRACSAREFEELLRASAHYCRLRRTSKLQIVWSNPKANPFRQFEDDADFPAGNPLPQNDRKD
jgi:hypothetical protein